MSSTTDKIQGTANQAIGKIKEGLGNVVGSEKLKAEGLVQQGKGAVQKGVGEAKDVAKDVVNKAADAADREL